MNIWGFTTSTVRYDLVLEDFELMRILLRAAYFKQFGRACYAEMHGNELHLVDSLGIEAPRAAVPVGNGYALSTVRCSRCNQLRHPLPHI